MRVLNFIDLIFQTLILGLIIVPSVFIAFTGNFESIAIIALYGALFLGPWQLVSSLVTTIAKGLFLKWRVIHLLCSIVYLVLISITVAYINKLEFYTAIQDIGRILAFGVPTVLAGFYYYITVRSFQTSNATTRVEQA